MGQKESRLDAPHLPKQSKRGQFPEKAHRGTRCALGCHFFNSSHELTLLCPAWGSQDPMQRTAAFPNRNTQLEDKGCRGMNVSGQKQKGNACEIQLISNISSPGSSDITLGGNVHLLPVQRFSRLGFYKSIQNCFKYLSNRLIAPGMSCREFISQSIWEIHGKD